MQIQKIPTKKSFKIDELSQELGVKKFVIKNWEKQFDLKKMGSDNKYTQEDFKVFAAIKNLIFVQKIPQGQVKKHLQDILNGDYVKTALDNVCTVQKQEPQEQILETSGHEQVQTKEEPVLIEEPMQIEEPALALETLEQPIVEQSILEQCQTYQAAQTEEISEEQETAAQPEINPDEIICATETEAMLEMKPEAEQVSSFALHDKEEFIARLQSFKTDLLKIHEQLK